LPLLCDRLGRTASGGDTRGFHYVQGGYYRNSIVREKSAAELLKALDERMEVHLKKPGSIEFAAASTAAPTTPATSVPPSARAASRASSVALLSVPSGSV
jgi:hypothetical protein